MQCAGCREELKPFLLKTAYIWCPDCKAYVCITCLKETGGKCPSCQGPALGRSLRFALFALLVLPSLAYMFFRSRRPIDLPMEHGPGMDASWVASLVLLIAWGALLVLVIVLMARRRYLHGKFVSTHDVLHARDVDTLRQRAEQGQQ